jgi:hypothetical protein
MDFLLRFFSTPTVIINQPGKLGFPWAIVSDVFSQRTASFAMRRVFITLRDPVRGARVFFASSLDCLAWSGIISEGDVTWRRAHS